MFVDWEEIFGKDRAIGEFAEGPLDAIEEIQMSQSSILFNDMSLGFPLIVMAMKKLVLVILQFLKHLKMKVLKHLNLKKLDRNKPINKASIPKGHLMSMKRRNARK